MTERSFSFEQLRDAELKKILSQYVEKNFQQDNFVIFKIDIGEKDVCIKMLNILWWAMDIIKNLSPCYVRVYSVKKGIAKVLIERYNQYFSLQAHSNNFCPLRWERES